MAGVINVAMRRAADTRGDASLVGRKAPLPGCRSVLVADRMSHFEVEISRGDVVACRGELGIVRACFQEGGAIGVIVETSAVRRWVAAHTVVVVRSGALQAWSADRLVLCVAWKEISAGELLVVCE